MARSKDNGRDELDQGRQEANDSQPNLDGIDLLELEAEDDLLEFEGSSQLKATIKVVGVGGGGGNALNTMIQSQLGGVEFIAANTDAQALEFNKAGIKLQLGAEVTRGLGCGANPDRGRAAALEARDRLREVLDGSDMVFVTAGMGGGTGTGAAPIVAEVARELGALTVGVVTKPFPFEGRVRGKHADRGLAELHSVVDTLITIPNQRLLSIATKSTGIKDAFKLADEVLLNAVRGISDLITIHGLINLDFADVRTVMNEAGVAMMGTGVGSGDSRAIDAAKSAISSPLLEDLSIDGAHGVLINITGGSDLTLFEVNEASMLVQEAAHEDANIIFGAVIDEEVDEGEIRVTVIATGLDSEYKREGADERGAAEMAAPNVRPLRREAPAPAPAPTPTPAALAAPVAAAAPAPAPPAAEAAPVAPQPVPAEAIAAPPAYDAPPSHADALQAEAIAEPELEPEPPAPPSPPAEEPQEVTAEELSSARGFASPFEDELDVPAFLRRRNADAEDEDRESPAFLRRAQD